MHVIGLLVASSGYNKRKTIGLLRRPVEASALGQGTFLRQSVRKQRNYLTHCFKTTVTMSILDKSSDSTFHK